MIDSLYSSPSKNQQKFADSLYVFTPLFSGATDDVSGHVNESCTYVTQDRSDSEIVSNFIFKISLSLQKCPTSSDNLRAISVRFSIKYFAQTPFNQTF